MANEENNENMQDTAEEGSINVNPVKLSEMSGKVQPAQSADGEELNLSMILDIPVDINVELGRTQLSIREVLKLGTGSIVELDRLAGQPADIIVNGKMIGQGDVVVVNENFGIRITKLVDPEQRLESF